MARCFRLRAGFTLPEILVVLAIMAILFLFSGQMLQNYKYHTALRLQEEQIVSFLELAKNMAQAHWNDSELLFDS